MGAGGFHGRVRDGIGCGLPAMATRSSSLSIGSMGWWVGLVRVWGLKVDYLCVDILVLMSMHGGGGL